MTDDGTCNSWQDSLALSDDEIATIVAWLDAGTPEGQPRDDLAVPEPPVLDGALTAATPEIVPMPEGGLLTMSDEYRCFLLDPGIEQDGFVTGSAVTPGNPALVHHVLGIVVDPQRINDQGQTNLEVIQALDAESPDRPGWPCLTLFEGIQPSGLPIVWAPGQGVTELPAGTGMVVNAGDLLVAQVHYNFVDTSLIGESDSTTLALRVEDTVEREGIYNAHFGLLQTLIDGAPHIIPPGEAAHEFSYTVPMDGYIERFDGAAELWGFFPHAHARAVSMSARILDANGQERACVGEVPRWDFNWQLYYFMEQPIRLEPGDQVEMSCIYDTTNETQPIIPGWGTANEMCFIGLYISQAESP